MGAADYGTAAFISGFPLAGRFGFGRGFDHFDDRLPEGFTTRGGETRGTERTAGKTVDAFLRWLGQGRKPFFAWVHLFDPHSVYAAPEPFARMYYGGDERDPENRSLDGIRIPAYHMLTGVTDIRFPVALYEGEVTYTDHELGRLFAALEERSILENTLVVITADHGESLTEHGYYFGHSHFLYEPSLRVPLLIRWPRAVPAGRIVDTPVSLLDLLPSIGDLLGIAMPAACDGRSIAPLIDGSEPGAAPVALFLERPLLPSGGLVGLREGDWKYLRAEGGEEELYRLDRDPAELRNLASEESDRAASFRDRLEIWFADAGAAAPIEMDEETREKLRGLGYIN